MTMKTGAADLFPCAGFSLVRQAWRVVRKRHLFDCGGQAVT
jgi:hypothetical protein